jgi:hypothetical protein
VYATLLSALTSGKQVRILPFTAWLLLSLLLAAHAAGEAAGYWRVVGDIEHRYEHFELHRLECLRPDERGLMTGT